VTRTTRFILLYYTDIAHNIRTNFHDRTVDRFSLFIFLVSLDLHADTGALIPSADWVKCCFSKNFLENFW